MTSRYVFLSQPTERRQLAMFRSSAAVAIVAGVIGLGFIAGRMPQHAASGNLGDELGPSAADAAALEPIDMGAEYQAAYARARMAATDQPSTAPESAAADDANRKALFMGEPAVF